MHAVVATPSNILCCLCGVPVQANPANMCVNCIRGQVDITEGIQKEVTIMWCKECNKYLAPPKAWVRAELESKELLTFCIKKLKGLNKVKLVDAGFIWTEPHSKRLKVKLTIQKEVFHGTILQQTFQADYVIHNHLCQGCQRLAANADQWVASVQVRQHVDHKRTFFLLEQLILKHNAQAGTLNIKEQPDGVDFFYGHRSHALKFIEFLNSVVPMKNRSDKQLVSYNEQNSVYVYKYTFSVQIVPICKEDICLLPLKVYQALGSFGPIVVCTHITNTVHLLDPLTLRVVNVDCNAYYRQPYTAIMSAKHLTEYVVLDTEDVGPTNGRWKLTDVQVARSADFGKNDAIFLGRTHLGHHLKPGDLVLGYDLTRANIVDPELEKYRGKLELPDVVLMRKSYAERRRKRREKGGGQRAWTLRRMEVETAETNSKKVDPSKVEADRERFMEELEEDPELRAKVQIFRDPKVALPQPGQAQMAETDDDDDEDQVPEVPLEELLGALTIDAVPAVAPPLPAGDIEDDDEDDEMEI
uniref:60S ribosomal export protein NMD3 n=1 Tax=Pyramimonas obovata TaxID=1411642 RepID=A0A7S0RDD9_9CHLO|mmetsp:Transcript_31015/g.67747  ORF Transcript_31015/g.67747 Transcript_31015/m.67747 type:complete len:528 (+) Transcript_31015:643-2226(+)